MGSSGSRSQLSLLWRLFAVVLVLNACQVSLINAKKISSLDDNDKLFFDLEDDTDPAAVSRSQRSLLDAQNAPLVDDGWFNQGVRRVRRELTRLFNGNERKSPTKRKLSKRQQRYEEYEADAGSGDGDTVSYRVRFSINEVYNPNFGNKQSVEFDQLNKEISAGLLDVFRQSYATDDDELDMSTTLLQVLPLKGDQFKSIVVLNLELPSIAQDFEDRLRNQLHNYNLIGKQSATLDDEFSFRSTADANNDTVINDPVIIPTEGSGNGGCRGDATFTCYKSNTIVCDELKCDGQRDCPRGEDEEGCFAGCTEEEFKCDDQCHPLSEHCDGIIQCQDQTDEAGCPGPEPEPKSNPEDVPEPKVNPETEPEQPATSAPEPPQYCRSDEYRCRSGLCIDGNRRCDSTVDCPDGDDEDEDCRCEDDQFRCRNGDCVNGNAQCNGYPECVDGSDEIDCPSQCLSHQFRCRNGQCVSSAVRCNGQTDCQDSSDEENCVDQSPSQGRNNQLNLKTYPDSQTIKESREVVFRCRDEGPNRAKVRWSRPGGRPLPAGFADTNGRLEIPNIRLEDAGTYVCEAVGYPSYIQGQKVTVQLTVERLNTVDHERPPTACSEYQATCMNGMCIDRQNICDGIPHCSDGSDEHSCSHGRKCQPNQFMCNNSKCVERTWRCDGENDCLDNSDEESCDPEPSGAPCRYNEYQCSSGHCIPKSFQCDDINDCRDGSDEIGCIKPSPMQIPPPMQSLLEGQPLNLTCTAKGIPIPTIVWRLNWGHVPDKCVSKSYGGRGNLYCPDMRHEDSGAYSCEILNTRGTHFVKPDTIVMVTPDRNQYCPAGFFNMLARSREDCIECFCFGVANSCESANLYTYAIQPPILSHRVVGVELSPYKQIVINEVSGHNILTLHHGVQFRASDVQYNSRETPYLALPTDYMGNQLKSYGGELKYEVSYVGNGRPISGPDVIITGNSFTLTYRVRTSANQVNKVAAPFKPGNWYKPDGRKATREEIMMILANVDNILIRLGYIDAVAREVELVNIALDSAGTANQGLGSASLVEKCSCPPGYVGDSCETCAPGYVRQPGGPWLGRCVPFVPEPCPTGTFGDPRRGIPCKPCPCPQSGRNNFASGCSLAPDGDVICNCYEGYQGRRCESCADGYQGNPIAVGGSCHKTPETSCNAEGTYSVRQDGSCECKPLVIGERCDQCAPKSFHLNSFVYPGCIECFCSGHQVDCTSTSWYREQISSNFVRSRAPHGFQLVRDYTRAQPELVPFDTQTSAITFRSNSDYNADTLYWSLPSTFLGNKLTAYGGRLNYTLSYSSQPGGQMSRNNAPDVVIKSGEDLTLIHHRHSPVSPSTSNSYAVRIIESEWHRSDGQAANRAQLLMALSKIDAIYIKATYTTSTMDGTLRQVVLDVASPTNTGTQHAYEVEECRCPQGYVGLSCETCAPGYKRNPEGGLYLGLCEPCECNGHSTQCDGETGECLNCGDNTEGENCDVCAPGYVGDATRGTSSDCQLDYNEPQPRPPQPPNTDDQVRCDWCNQNGLRSCSNGVCNCKPNVIGDRCDQCREGTFGLSYENPSGCKECFCSGQSSRCRSATLYQQLLAIDFITNEAIITDEEGQRLDTENLDRDIPNNRYTYSHPSYTNKYWSLHGSVQGNHLNAYGGKLNYTLSSESTGNYQAGSDVVIIGNGIRLIWSRAEEDSYLDDYTVRLDESEQWQRVYLGRLSPATRNDIMSALSNVEYLLIRATPKIPTLRSTLSDITMEAAVEFAQPGAERSVDIEVCQCPAGYTGKSCESCAPLHYRTENGQCRACPCQEENTQSCLLDTNGYVECRCKPRFTGDRCQDIDYGKVEPEPQEPDNIHAAIIVSILKDQITIMPVGGSMSLSCSGRLRSNNDPVVVNWSKQDGSLPYNAEIQGGVLIIHNLQITDSGVYICRAVDNQTSRVYADDVSIIVTPQSQRTPARIENLPRSKTFSENVPDEINCEVSGNPTPSVIWTRVDGQADGYTTTDGTRLIFNPPRKSDEGRYRCVAQNELASDERYVQVYVRTSAPAPTPQRVHVYIQPKEYNGQSGDDVIFTCQSTHDGSLRYEWLFNGYPISVHQLRNVYARNELLEIRDATDRNSGTFTCIGTDLRTHRNYSEDAQVYIEQRPQRPIDNGIIPVIQRLEQSYVIDQGTDLSIPCVASGSPYPTIKWTKVGEAMPTNVQQTDNVLRILNANPKNRGVYICLAENSFGGDTASTSIDVEPREHPSVEIEPAEQKPISVGSEGVLYCIGLGIPTPTVQWRRIDGTPLSPRHQEIQEGYISIKDIQVEDAGDYECVAENALGRATATTNLRVFAEPVIELMPSETRLQFTEGDEVHVTCMASGVPNPTVQWKNNQSPQTYGVIPSLHGLYGQNTADLIIDSVSQSDAGVYTCVATSEAGSDEVSIAIDVQAKRGDIGEPFGDVHHLYPQRPDNSQQFATKLGDNVTLTCNNLHPQLQTSWERVDGREMLPNTYANRDRLVITSVVEQNLGMYRCNAIDPSGNVVTFVVRELVLLPLPQITFEPRIPLVVDPDSNVEINCRVTDASPDNVRWATDNNRPLPSSVYIEGSLLRFIAITPADAGDYACTAWNEYGNVTKIAQVKVKRPSYYQPQPQSEQQVRYEGETIQLHCSVSTQRGEQRQNVEFRWFRQDRQPLPNNARSDSPVLELTSLRPEDSGIYICDPYDNDAQKRLPHTSIDLRVQKNNMIPCVVFYICTGVATTPAAYPGVYLPPPQEPTIPRDYSLKLDQQSSKLRVGESTEVECYSSDNSYTDVIWERADGVPLTSNIQQQGNRLVISQVTAADAGNYVCKCRTDQGDLYTTSYELAIEEQPHDLRRPKIVHAAVSDGALLDCGADEERQPTYRWSRQYGQLQSGRDLLSNQLSLQNVQANDAGSYICTATYADGESVDHPSILVVTGTIPHFHQQPLSYLSFPTLPNSSFKFNFELTFRPESGNGLLLFNGQTRGTGDYIALSLKDRFAEFRFDFGGKPLVVRAEQPLDLNEWHTVRVHRSRRDGYIQVDEQHPVAFPTLSQTPQLELTEDLYIGGVPNWDLLPSDAITQRTGFVGCISRLSLQGRSIELVTAAKIKEGITSCKPCADAPCTNGGICLESQTELAYTCVCQQGWTGRNCAIAGNQCTPGMCGAGRCQNTELDMECLCPLNRTGDRCQYNEHLNEHSLNFKRNSYAAYSTPRVSRINVTLTLRPNSLQDAVLLYTAESELPSGDYIALVLRDGHVELLINTAARLKPVVVRSQQPLALHKWTRVELLRRQGESILRVGDEPEQRAKAAGVPRTLSLKTPLYIGGYDRTNVKINRDVNITEGFDGCISRLYSSKVALNLLTDIEDAANVQNCGELNEIGDNDQDGELPVGPVPDQPLNIFSNEEEQQQPYVRAPCAADPCENGGTCSESEQQAICACSLGYSGKHCEEHIQVGFNASFRGNGYLEIDRNQFSTDIDQKRTTAVVVFSTTKSNGLLLWWGQKAGEEYEGGDFIAVAIVDGYVEYSLRLNGEETEIRNTDHLVNDGDRHIVILRRDDNTAMLEVDSLSTSGETRPTVRKAMHLPGNVFIGGIPDISKFTGARYSHNFNGCIVVVEGDAAGQMNLGKTAVSGVNVGTCPLNNEAQGGSEPSLG